MTHHFFDLTNVERTELLEALRRDMRQQDRLAESTSEWANWHAYNARTIKRILECLNPKTIPLEPGSSAGGHSRAKLARQAYSGESLRKNVEPSSHPVFAVKVD